MARKYNQYCESGNNLLDCDYTVLVSKPKEIGLTDFLPQGMALPQKQSPLPTVSFTMKNVLLVESMPSLTDYVTTLGGLSNGNASMEPSDLLCNNAACTPFESEFLHFASIREAYEKFHDGLNQWFSTFCCSRPPS